MSPAVTLALRRRVWSRVPVDPVPHSWPGSNPIWPKMSMATPECVSATASLPSNQKALEEKVWLALALSASLASVGATTQVPPG